VTRTRRSSTLPGTAGRLSTRCSRRRLLLLALAPLAVACRAARSSDDIVSTWVIDPRAPRVGAVTQINLMLRDADGQPVRGAMLRMAAHMTHPGMAPILADAVETVPGSYAVVVQLTMGGDWTLVASGALPDGRRITRSVDIRSVK
jgi:hypothetical protein